MDREWHSELGATMPPSSIVDFMASKTLSMTSKANISSMAATLEALLISSLGMADQSTWYFTFYGHC